MQVSKDAKLSSGLKQRHVTMMSIGGVIGAGLFVGAIALLVYLVIAVSQLRMRAKLELAKDGLQLKMWCFPWLTWAVIAFVCGVLIMMLLGEEHRIEAAATGALAICVVAASWLNRRYRLREEQTQPARVHARVQ